MKVAFDSRATSDPNGVGRYSRCILAALRETVPAGDELIESSRPAAVRARNPDLLHAPSIDGALLHSPCPTIVSVHDIAPLGRRSEHLRGGVRLRMRRLALERAARLIVPSESVAADAGEHLRIDRERITVIPHAPGSAMRPRDAREVQAAREQLVLPDRYLVWAGDLRHPLRGRQLARLAATPRESAIVIAGPAPAWARELPGVIATGALADDRLAAVYSGAGALVLAAADAGCVLAALDALACGTPVVACDEPLLREALEEHARFVAAGDLAGLIEAAQEAERAAEPPRFASADAGGAMWRLYAEALAAPRAARVPRGRPARGLGL